MAKGFLFYFVENPIPPPVRVEKLVMAVSQPPASYQPRNLRAASMSESSFILQLGRPTDLPPTSSITFAPCTSIIGVADLENSEPLLPRESTVLHCLCPP